MTAGFILSDGLAIRCDSDSSICGLMTALLAAYCAWDLSFPRVYQLVALLGDVKAEIYRGTEFTKVEKSLKCEK